MGQKVSPIGLRLGINRTWDSRWFANKKDYVANLHNDLKIRDYIEKALPNAGISKVVIERPAKKAVVSIHTARPGIIIGNKGEDIEKLKNKVSQFFGQEVALNIMGIKRPELDAKLVAQSIASQIEKRVNYKKAMKRAIQLAMRQGAEGIRVMCGGRLSGAEIARSEEYREGRVPLHTLRTDVDYHECGSHTAYGVIGVKVWISCGEILEHDPMAHEKRKLQR